MRSAYIAGLYDAEGSTHISSPRGRRYLRMEITQVDKNVLELGFGSLTGPYSKKTNKKPLWRLTVSTESEADRILQEIWPFLGIIKKQQVLDVLPKRTGEYKFKRFEMSDPKFDTEEDGLAWAAGFFTGDGCLYFDKRSGPGSRGNPRLVPIIGQCHPEVLHTFQQIVGVGKVNGPYIKSGYKPQILVWEWKLHSRNLVREMFERLDPYFGDAERKLVKEQFAKI